MSKWLLKLEGHRSDLERLATELSSGGCTVEKRGEDYYLWARALESETDLDAVMQFSANLLASINGAARLKAGEDFSRVKVGDECIELEDDGRESRSFLWAGQHAYLRAVDDLSGERLRNLRIWVEAAREEERIAKAFRILGSFKTDWRVLNNLYEIVSEEFHRQKGEIQRHGLAQKVDIDRFEESANDPRVSGDEARHGYQKRKRPLRYEPMTVRDGEDFIRDLLKRWLEWKLERGSGYRSRMRSSAGGGNHG